MSEQPSGPVGPIGAPFYAYRYRIWDTNVYWGNRHKPTPEELNGGWGEWEWIDEKKYNEILSYISGDNPCVYHAERIVCHVTDSESFCPQTWVDQQIASLAERNPNHPKVR